MARWTGRTSRLSLMLILNLLCFIMEFSVGFLFKSMVLTADAFNVLSDFLGVVIALACMKISAKGPSDRNTFGWMRCDVLGALINAVFMIALCFTIFLDSLQRFIEPERVDQPRTVLIVGTVGLIVNLVGMFVLKDYRSVPKEEKLPSSTNLDNSSSEVSVSRGHTSNKKGASSRMNMYGAYLHILGDALGSVVVIICALIDWQLPNVSFLQRYLDPILSILVAIMLTVSSVSLLKESSLTLLQAVPTKVNLMQLKANIMERSKHIIEMNNLHVWQLSSEKLVASVRVRFDDTLAWDEMLALVHQVESCFYDEGIHVVTVHPEVMTVESESKEKVRETSDVCCRIDVDSDSGINGILVTADARLRVSIHGKPTKPNEDVTVFM